MGLGVTRERSFAPNGGFAPGSLPRMVLRRALRPEVAIAHLSSPSPSVQQHPSKGRMDPAPKNSSPASPLSAGVAERVLLCVQTVALLAESSATTRTELYEAALVLKKLNQDGIAALLADVERRLADPALRATGEAAASAPPGEQAKTSASAEPVPSSLPQIAPIVVPSPPADVLLDRVESTVPPSPAPVQVAPRVFSVPRKREVPEAPTTERPSWIHRIFGFREAETISLIPKDDPQNDRERPAVSPALSARKQGPAAAEAAFAPTSTRPEARSPAETVVNPPAEEAADLWSWTTLPTQHTELSSVQIDDASAKPSTPPTAATVPKAALPAPDRVESAVPAVPPQNAPFSAASAGSAPVVPAPFTTGRWDSGKRARLAGQSRIDPAPPTPRPGGPVPRQAEPVQRPAESRINNDRRGSTGAEEDLVRPIPATAWIPRNPEPPARDIGTEAQQPTPLTRRWELLSRFDSGMRPAAGPRPARPGPARNS